MLAYPAYQVSEETVALTDAWLAAEGHSPSLRRLVAEGRDGVLRALKARAKDASAWAGIRGSCAVRSARPAKLTGTKPTRNNTA